MRRSKRLPRPSARRRLALCLARRHLCQSPAQPSHRLDGADRRGRRQHRRPARSAGHGHRAFGGGDLLGRVPPQTATVRPVQRPDWRAIGARPARLAAWLGSREPSSGILLSRARRYSSRFPECSSLWRDGRRFAPSFRLLTNP